MGSRIQMEPFTDDHTAAAKEGRKEGRKKCMCRYVPGCRTSLKIAMTATTDHSAHHPMHAHQSRMSLESVSLNPNQQRAQETEESGKKALKEKNSSSSLITSACSWNEAS